MKIDIVFFASHLIAKSCLEILGEYCRILAVVETGDQLKPLPHLSTPAEYLPNEDFSTFNHTELIAGRADFILKQATLGVSIGYGKILKPEIFQQPSFGTVNLHTAYLPDYRGVQSLASTRNDTDAKDNHDL